MLPCSGEYSSSSDWLLVRIELSGPFTCNLEVASTNSQNSRLCNLALVLSHFFRTGIFYFMTVVLSFLLSTEVFVDFLFMKINLLLTRFLASFSSEFHFKNEFSNPVSQHRPSQGLINSCRIEIET